jgi:hypothetical protein
VKLPSAEVEAARAAAEAEVLGAMYVEALLAGKSRLMRMRLDAHSGARDVKQLSDEVEAKATSEHEHAQEATALSTRNNKALRRRVVAQTGRDVKHLSEEVEAARAAAAEEAWIEKAVAQARREEVAAVREAAAAHTAEPWTFSAGRAMWRMLVGGGGAPQPHEAVATHAAPNRKKRKAAVRFPHLASLRPLCTGPCSS